jgi:hypothetical protein
MGQIPPLTTSPRTGLRGRQSADRVRPHPLKFGFGHLTDAARRMDRVDTWNGGSGQGGSGIIPEERKGKLTGQKPPLKMKEVRAIRIRFQLSDQVRELALFNLAIDSKPRGRDLVAVKVGDVAVAGHGRGPRLPMGKL